MGWQDRGYNRRITGGSPSGNPILQLFLGSVPLGTWFGIRVRVHASLLWVMALQLWAAGQIGWQSALASSVALFSIVLLHEFGHCIGARMVGGHAEEILLWPLGGLAMTDGTHTAWARFVTVACGPLVNLILGFIAGAWIFQITGAIPPINPLLPFIGRTMPGSFPWELLTVHGWGFYLKWAYATNVSLLLFNLLPIFPFDGGQLLQTMLWKMLGYYKSMYIACVVGMVGSALMAVFGLTPLVGSMMFVFLGIMGFMTCYQQIQILKETGPETYAEEPQYAFGDERPRPVRRHRRKGWFRMAARRARQEQKEQARIDAILAKVHEKGLHSLTWWEKRALRKATERQRQEDLAERL
jgi:stage IV sporulation protein FB